jgi:glycosyltransferase involved in cell wall biosynthesis
MPLTQDSWANGKSGFKAIFYQSLGIPAVVSPSDVVLHGTTGFHATSTDEWVECIAQLMRDPDLRVRMGRQARVHAETHYSLQSVVEKMRRVLEDIVPH